MIVYPLIFQIYGKNLVVFEVGIDGPAIHMTGKLFLRFALRSLDAIRLDCDSLVLASSYERAIQSLLRRAEMNDLPLVVWVLTSGKIQLSEETLRLIRQKQTRVTVVLYNRILEKDLAPIVAKQAEKVGKNLIQLTIYTRDDAPNGQASTSSAKALLPAIPFLLEVHHSYKAKGPFTALNMELLKDDAPVASYRVKVNLSQTGIRGVVAEYYPVLMVIAVIVLLLVGLFIFYRYYRPKFCPQCKRQMRREDSFCPFCRANDFAFVVGSVGHQSIGTNVRELIRLCKPIVEGGTHRRALIRFPKSKSDRRRCFFKIHRERSQGETFFRLSRVVPMSQCLIEVNGNAVEGHRYLVSGDTIKVGEFEFIFMFNGRRQYDHKTNRSLHNTHA